MRIAVPLAAVLLAASSAFAAPAEHRFACGETECAAWLVLPEGVARPPVVVMAHGFAGTRDLQMPAYAAVFARHGLASFIFDYRHFGASGGEPRQIVDMARQREDWRAALAYLRGQDEVDSARIALWGSSLGGGHALIAAADDGSVRAVVAQVPMVDADADAPRPPLSWIFNVLWTATWDSLRSVLGLSPYYVPVVAEPGTFAVVNFEGAMEVMLPLVPAGSPWENRVAARLFFGLANFRPIAHAGEISAPVLLLPARDDEIVPLASVEAFAEAAPDARVHIMDGGHFGLYVEPALTEAAEIEARFLAEHLAE
ncbi:MAG: alpha/beta fold hydrolase [Parvibaculum sp.]|nr:alpha/beta fold hydrolase [Parvibaculum sp.]